MHRVDAAGQTIVRSHGQPMGLGLGESCVRGHHTNGGVGARQQRLCQFTAQQAAPGIGQLQPVSRTRTRHRAGGIGVQHIAHGIAGNQRAHRHTIDRDRGGSNAALHGACHAKHLAHTGAGARADVALQRVSPRGGCTGGISSSGIGANAHVPHHQVEQHSGRHQRQASHANVQPHALFFEPAHSAGGGLQAPGTAARKHDGVHLLDQVAGVEQIGLARAGRGATHIDTGHGPRTGQHHAAARGAAAFSEMADLDTGHTGDAAHVAGAGRGRNHAADYEAAAGLRTKPWALGGSS